MCTTPCSRSAICVCRRLRVWTSAVTTAYLLFAIEWYVPPDEATMVLLSPTSTSISISNSTQLLSQFKPIMQCQHNTLQHMLPNLCMSGGQSCVSVDCNHHCPLVVAANSTAVQRRKGSQVKLVDRNILPINNALTTPKTNHTP